MIWTLILAIEDEREHSIAENIFLTRYDSMCTQAYKILKNEEDTKDAVMTAFKNIIEHIHKFKGSTENNDRLIYIYTRNAAIDIYRRRKTHGTLSLDNPFDDEDGKPFHIDYADPRANVEDLVINADTLSKVENAIKQLPLSYREIIYLRYYNEYDCTEIAKVLSVNVGTVWTRIHRAKNALKELLQNELPD